MKTLVFSSSPKISFLGTLDLANRIVTIVGKTKAEFDVLQCAASEIKSGEFSLTSAGFRFVLF